MNEIELLSDDVRASYPEATLTIDEPLNASGHWFLDIKLGPATVAVQWMPGKGFGVSRVERGDAYGEGPDAVFETRDQAMENVRQLLTQAK